MTRDDFLEAAIAKGLRYRFDNRQRLILRKGKIIFTIDQRPEPHGFIRIYDPDKSYAVSISADEASAILFVNGEKADGARGSVPEQGNTRTVYGNRFHGRARG